jgi:ATP-dependent Lon protease
MELDDLDRAAADAFHGLVVRKDLVRQFRGQFPVPTYAQGQLQDHRETAELFQKEASSGQDPALKAFAQKTLPILQQHLQMVEALNKR